MEGARGAKLYRLLPERPMVDAVRERVIRLGRLWLSVFFWTLFVAGLLLQTLGPHLRVKDNRFILPPSVVSAGTDVRPAAIVARERKKQVLSAVLTVGGAVGLALSHRKALFGRQSSRRDLAGGSNEVGPGC